MQVILEEYLKESIKYLIRQAKAVVGEVIKDPERVQTYYRIKILQTKNLKAIFLLEATDFIIKLQTENQMKLPNLHQQFHKTSKRIFST